jgi:hypothetical protein
LLHRAYLYIFMYKGVCGLHPSKSLGSRSKGFGIGGGYERPLRKSSGVVAASGDVYGTVPPSGYYGGSGGHMPFGFGEAGFEDEIRLYFAQYGQEVARKVEKS